MRQHRQHHRPAQPGVRQHLRQRRLPLRSTDAEPVGRNALIRYRPGPSAHSTPGRSVICTTFCTTLHHARAEKRVHATTDSEPESAHRCCREQHPRRDGRLCECRHRRPGRRSRFRPFG
ncbi:hypothetical protein SBRY_50397 [Actinacidiphila bryophytorum]|uniref:Uncharacterized protein n=1 Tax=Actinacidiphila bryophytorum TaxID=1436133 RepID=A0A9W4MJA5_9ACTN|nr:hypothetical protein SBRY_50397 [Actinacidiphila bryophytorum]